MNRCSKTILFFVLAALLRTSFAQEAELRITPGEIKFDAQRKQSVLVVLRNGGTSTLGDVRLRWLSPENFTVVAESSTQDKLPAGGDAVWQLTVEQVGDASHTDKVLVRVDYTNAPGTTVVRHTTTGSFTVAGPTLPAAETLLEVTADTTIESLTAQTPGRVYLSITNKSKYPLSIGNITTQNEFITTQIISSPSILQVSDTAVAILKLDTTRLVNPGKYLLVASVPFSWTQGTRSFSARAVAKKEIPVGVFGESEVLKLLAIPSLLILPGFLFVVTLGLLWKLKLFRENDGDQAFVLQARTPEFWLIAITFSMFMAYVYPRFGWGNNYLERYELADLIRVWTISIFGFGLLGYFIVALALKLVRTLRTKRARQSIISIQDKPIDVLRKLDRIGVGLYPKRANLAGSGEYVFIYEEAQAGQDALVVGPLLRLTWGDGAEAVQRESIDDIVAANEENTATRIADALAKIDPNTFRLGWPTTGSLKELTSVSADKLENTGTRSPVSILQIN